MKMINGFLGLVTLICAIWLMFVAVLVSFDTVIYILMAVGFLAATIKFAKNALADKK